MSILGISALYLACQTLCGCIFAVRMANNCKCYSEHSPTLWACMLRQLRRFSDGGLWQGSIRRMRDFQWVCISFSSVLPPLPPHRNTCFLFLTFRKEGNYLDFYSLNHIISYHSKRDHIVLVSYCQPCDRHCIVVKMYLHPSSFSDFYPYFISQITKNTMKNLIGYK